MDIHSNLEYLCRVCAGNTKGKNSVAECVYIFKTPELKDKLDKFLYLKISEKDSLPKVLCKACFRQVEAAASLSKIAKHTQQVFRDFLLSNLPKGPSESSSTAEFTSSDFMGNKNDTSEKNATLAPALKSSMPQLPPPPPPPPASAPSLPPPLVQTSAAAARKDEVVVNVSVTDPLTRDNQQKMISNSQRRQSLLLDSRFTPKSIAQKQVTASFVAPRNIAPKANQPNETINTTNNSKASAPIVNFYAVKSQPQQTKSQQQLPQTTQITTFSSGGYVIGRINANSSDKEEPKKLALPLTPSVDNILQQKRKNLVKALNNIKANNSGQVSLLKSSQQKQAEALQNLAKAAFTEVVNQATEDELPEKIIIAAPKNKNMTEKAKKEPLNLSSKIPATIAPLPATAVPQQPEQSNPLNGNLPKPAFPEDITLGRVIRDMDLLKLILKALKWPVSKQNMELQLQRLRNSKFTDIMSDPNLLQDTDLTQLLGPYLAPVLMAAQALQQQQQQIMNNSTTLSNQNSNITAPPAQPKMTALEAAQAEINKSIPYKLPPETSVQLVPATPEETETTPSPLPTVNTSTTASVSLKRERPKDAKSLTASQKKQRKSAAQRARDSIIISDEEELATGEVAAKKSRSNKSAANIQFELDPNFLAQFNLLNGAGGNEAEELMALLLKQKAALLKDNKVQKWRRNSVSNLISLPPSEFDSLIDLDDDIVLMEPASNTSPETSTSTPEQQPLKTDITNTFVIPSVPLITRPIIKRRKTVIHSPKNRFNPTSEIKNNEPNPSPPVSLLKSKDKLIEETINQVVAGNITNTDNKVTTTPVSTITNEKAVVIAPAELQPVKLQALQKKIQNKSTLGKQLLEAIGLQKLPPKTTNVTTLIETPSSSSVPKAKMMLPGGKQSVQQIRSALKKSLKQAQEQQQQKQKELSSTSTNNVIQDADSTTKPAVKEVLVVEGKANKADNCSSEVDVEEQIDKVTLMVRNNEEDACDEQSKKNKTNQEKDEKKEGKKSAINKMQERHRTIANRNNEDKEKCNVEQHQEPPEKSGERKETDIEKEKQPNEIFVNNKSNESSVPASHEVVAPKRRGRKRLLDKQLELEAAEAKEKEAEKLQALDKFADDETETINSIKTEEENENNKTSGRPTRQSKTQSRYYKGPEKPILGKRSLPSRTTRNRKYC